MRILEGEKKNNNRKTGAIYEKRAVALLEQKGYQILEKNFCSRYGEIDIIAMDKGTLVFVEVKYRSNTHMGMALEAITSKKQRRLVRTAEYYRYCHNQYHVPCRFDLIAFDKEQDIHLENAFWAKGDW